MPGADKLLYYDKGLEFPNGFALPIGGALTIFTAKVPVEKARQIHGVMSPENVIRNCVFLYTEDTELCYHIDICFAI